MTEWITQIEGTEAGNQAALWLACRRRLLHAVLAHCKKGGNEPVADRGAIDCSYCLMAALSRFLSCHARAHSGPFLPRMGNSHCLQAVAGLGLYQGRSVVYPVVRGRGLVSRSLCLSDFRRELYRRTSGWGLAVLRSRGSLAGALQTLCTSCRTRYAEAAWACCSNRLFVAAVHGPPFFFLDGYGIPADRDPYLSGLRFS